MDDEIYAIKIQQESNDKLLAEREQISKGSTLESFNDKSERI